MWFLPESLSKYAFGVKIAEKFGFEKNLIQPKSVTEGGLLAARSPRLTLKIDKLKEAKIYPARTSRMYGTFPQTLFGKSA